MKKKIVASLVATLAVGATCAFAANPFVDVPADSWAYKSVSQLAQQGVIQGVDGSYFQGERNITRYEAAEMVAKAMAHMDKADAEQRAMINKLADEFSDELNNLGVRVTNLENRVGNVKTTGDFRLRYRHQETNTDKIKDPGYQRDGQDTSDNFTYRARVRFNANVNDSTKVTIGLSSDNINFDSGKSAQDNSSYVDLANVSTNFGNHFNVMAGRWTYVMGGGLGLQYGDTFDGIQGKYMGNNWSLTAGYGEFKEGAGYVATGEYKKGHGILNSKGYYAHDLTGVKTGYAAIDGTIGRVGVGMYYNALSDSKAADQNLKDMWGGYLKSGFGRDWSAIVDYQKVQKENSTDADDDAALWGAQIQYKAADFAKKGSWDAWLEYINADSNALYGSTNSWRNNSLLDNVKSWGVGVDYTVAKNVMFSAMQSFASSAKDGDIDPEEETRAQFVFVF